MSPHTSNLTTMLRITRWLGLGLVAACLGLSGCNSLESLRGEGFKDSSSEQVRRFRESDGDTQFLGFSNKAREIERDLGAH
jgi:hypothetical protein